MSFHHDIVKISDFLYISNWETSNNPFELKKHNIKAVLTIETNNKPNHILNYYKQNNIDFLFLYLKDLPNENIAKYFDISYDFIDRNIKKGNNVLVHCMAGISRSSTLILNYLMRKYYEKNIYQNKCSDCVLNFFLHAVRTKRQIINPNKGFINQLKYYYN